MAFHTEILCIELLYVKRKYERPSIYQMMSVLRKVYEINIISGSHNNVTFLHSIIK